MDDQSFTVRVPKRWARIAMIVGVTALIVAPLTAVATHSFTDVPNDNTFHTDIEWLADAGVTKGCNPPDNTEFCPDDPVTREQMSAFMRRLAQYMGAEDGTPARADNGALASIHTGPLGTGFAEGIVDVTNTDTGIYCLQLAPELGLVNGDVYAQVSVEWGSSNQNDLLAYWQETGGFGCPANQVEIRTYDFAAGGQPTLSNDVAFVATIYRRPAGNSVQGVSEGSADTERNAG